MFLSIFGMFLSIFHRQAASRQRHGRRTGSCPLNLDGIDGFGGNKWK
jgi:hypothetical protein